MLSLAVECLLCTCKQVNMAAKLGNRQLSGLSAEHML
jgi:hypothetical protein